MAWKANESKQKIHPNESVLFLWWFRETVISRWKSWFSIAADSTRHARAYSLSLIFFFFFWVIGFHLCIQLALAHSSTTIVLEDVFYDFWSHLFFLLEHTWTSVSSGGWIVSVVCILHTFHLILLWVNKPNAILVWLFGPEHALFAPHQSCLTPPHSFPFKCVSHWPLGNAVLNLNTFLSGQEVKGLTSEHVVNRAYSQHFTSN